MSSHKTTGAEPDEFTNEISIKRQQVLGKYQTYRSDLSGCEIRLENLLKFQKFSVNADELERWIADRMTNARDNSWKNKTNLQVYLQKHSALEAEVNANEETLTKLDSDGKNIIENDLPSTDAVQTRLMDIHQQWSELLDALKLRATRLQQTINVKLYLQKCQESLYWIKDKEAIVMSKERGNDLPHVMMLKGKFDEFINEVHGYEDIIKELNKEATKLVEEDKHPENKIILEKQHEVNEEWEKLQDLAKIRQSQLQNSIEIQTFRRDVEEAISWMSEKEELLASNQVGSDVTSVEALQRRHEIIERDLAALEEKVTVLCTEAERLEKDGDDVGELRDEMMTKWRHVTVTSLERKQLLGKNHRVQRFLFDCKELKNWSVNMESRLKSEQLATDVTGAESLVDKHQEHHGEINAQESTFTEVVECGKFLLIEFDEQVKKVEQQETQEVTKEEETQEVTKEEQQQQQQDREENSSSSSSSDDDNDADDKKTKKKKRSVTSASVKEASVTSAGVTGVDRDVISANLDDVVEWRDMLMEIWEERRSLYDQCLHLTLFTRDAEQAELWLATQENLLEDKNVGYSLDSTETLMKKIEDFIKSVHAQEEKISSVNEVAVRLVEKNHYDAEAIEQRRAQLLERHSKLRLGMMERQTELKNEYQLRLYERDIESILSWINDKMIIAMDDSYKDSINVHAKLERHRVFEKEIRASDNHVESCIIKSTQLPQHDSDVIIQQTNHVREEWNKLLEQCKIKGERLEESYAEQLFNRSVNDLLDWMRKILASFNSKDEGVDVQTVSDLVKKHQLLEVEVQMHKDRIDGIEIQTRKFVDEKHFDCDVIKEKQVELSGKYQELQEPLKDRNARLSASLRSKLLLRDIADELEWIDEKLFVASSPYIGKDLSLVGVVARKHKLIGSEISSHQSQIDEICSKAEQLVNQENRDSEKITERKVLLERKWANLVLAASERELLLLSAIEAGDYLEYANDAQAWIDEKKRIMTSHVPGKNEDTAESMLRKHAALLVDIDGYKPTVAQLRHQAEKCKLQSPMEKSSINDVIAVVHDYRSKYARELSVRENDPLTLISAYNKEWWKVENGDGKVGFVPSTHLRRVPPTTRKPSESDDDDDDDDDDEKLHPTLTDTQLQLEEKYGQLIEDGQLRRIMLENSLKKFALIRECDDNLQWIEQQKQAATQYQLDNSPPAMTSLPDDDDDVTPVVSDAVGLEQVETLQRQLDDFQRDLKASGKHIDRLNNEAKLLAVVTSPEARDRKDSMTSSSSSSSSSSVTSSVDEEDATPGGATTTTTFTDKIKLLNDEWTSLQGMINNLNEHLGSAYQVQRFFRDADETNEWIDEKNCALNETDVGSDLLTVQALQRKHEGLERELAALGERIYSLDEDAENLSKSHPDQHDNIENKRTEINKSWNNVVEKAKDRKRHLSDSYDLQRFLADHNDIKLWMNSVLEQISNIQLADDVTATEALLHRHQECRTDIDGKSPVFHALEQQADQLVRSDNSSSNRIDDIIQQVSHQREDIERTWASTHVLLEQCLKLHLFMRDCSNAECWMKSREDFLKNEQTGDSLDSVECLITKHEDFDRAISIQETKMSMLQQNCERLLNYDPKHYANEEIDEKMKQVEERWEKLKKALMEKRSRLGENQNLQQFSRDADEADAWILDKLQLASDCSYKDATNIQSKHQKHETFEAELQSNHERIKSIISAGQQLIDNNQCPNDSEDAVRARIGKLSDEWNNLNEKSKEKGRRLNDANEQHSFVISAKNLQLWISEMETLMDNEDVGKDLPSVEKLMKKQENVEADVVAHEEIVKLLNKNAQELLNKNEDNNDAIDFNLIEEKQNNVDDKLSSLKMTLKRRRSNLQLSLKIHQFYYDVTEEELWINEKKLLISNKDCGKNLTSCGSAQKKHKRIEHEITSHHSNIHRILKLGEDLKEEVEDDEEKKLQQEIEGCMKKLQENWENLKEECSLKNERISEAYAFQKFRFDVDEELSWLNSKHAIINSQVFPTTLELSQKFLNKFEGFVANLKVHRERIRTIQQRGRHLIEQENPDSEEIGKEMGNLAEKEKILDETAAERLMKLRQINKFLQFNWKVDLICMWMNEKVTLLNSDVIGENPLTVRTQIGKMETFEAGLKAFEVEEIENINKLKLEICEDDEKNCKEIQEKFDDLMSKWKQLKEATEERKLKLWENEQRLRQIDDLYLLFAKKASGFNSWFENVEEDLTDPIKCHSLQEIQTLTNEHQAFCATLQDAKKDLDELTAIDEKLEELGSPGKDGENVHVSTNPYTWFTEETLQETWTAVKRMITDRKDELEREADKQQVNDELRMEFAKYANQFHTWLTESRVKMMTESGTLESQLDAIKQLSNEIVNKRTDLSKIEELGSGLEENLILDNTYTEHSTLGLAQQWDELEQLTMRMEHNLDQQIQARNMTGVSEEALKEFSLMFKHFDKNQTGKLEHHEFKSCLRSLGYDLPTITDEDAQFQSILDIVDPNRDGIVSLQEYMGFMISRETENINSIEEIESSFKALSANGKSYVTKDELYQNLTKRQAEYCIREMPPHRDSHGIEVINAFDYVAFTKKIFMN